MKVRMAQYHLFAVPKYENFVDSIPLHHQYSLDFSDIEPNYPNYHSLRFPFKDLNDDWISLPSIMTELHEVVILLQKNKITNWVIIVPSNSMTDFTERYFTVLFKNSDQALRFRLSC